MTDGNAEEAQLPVSRPAASVGKDASVVVDVIYQDMEGLGRDDEFDFAIAVGHAGHSGR